MSATVLANMKETFQAFSEAFGRLDPDAITATWAEGCTYNVVPKSLGFPVRNLGDFRTVFAPGGPLATFGNLKVSDRMRQG